MIKLLLADDHTVVREALRFLLEAAGDIEIIAMASNGHEAVNLAGDRCPDVAVMDVSMPVLDGIDATRQIRVCCPEARILMLSMYHTHYYVERSLRAGASGYVLKDAAGSELINAVRSVYKGNRYFSKPIAEIAKLYLQ